MENEYVLKSSDDWFIKQKRKDLFTQEYFKEGDSIVLCAQCRTVMLSDAWKYYGNRCLNCKHDHTVPFSKENCEYYKGGDSNINIIGYVIKEEEDEVLQELVSSEELENMDKRFVLFMSIYNVSKDFIARNEKNLHRLHIFTMICAIVLTIGSIGFTVVKYEDVKEKYSMTMSQSDKATDIKRARENISHAEDKLTACKESFMEHSEEVIDKNIDLAKKNIGFVENFFERTWDFLKECINKPVEFFQSLMYHK